jgi:hypothetical protein
MSIEEKVPVSRTSITIVVIVLLCAAGFAYSQGWFNWSSSGSGVESDTVSADQMIDQDGIKEVTPGATQQMTETAATPTE